MEAKEYWFLQMLSEIVKVIVGILLTFLVKYVFSGHRVLCVVLFWFLALSWVFATSYYTITG